MKGSSFTNTPALVKKLFLLPRRRVRIFHVYIVPPILIGPAGPAPSMLRAHTLAQRQVAVPAPSVHSHAGPETPQACPQMPTHNKTAVFNRKEKDT